METEHVAKRKQKSGELPDLESVLRKQQTIAFVALLILAVILGLAVAL
jgi:hypothetical protein